MENRTHEISSPALALVRRFRRQVLSGQLLPGARLPSVRRLAREGGVAVHVAHQALRKIEAEGWAKRRKSGYILWVIEDARALAEDQLRCEPPVVVTIVSPKRNRSADANLIDELADGINEIFPVCSLRTLYIDRERWLGQVSQLLEQESRAPRETGFLLRSVPPEIQHFFESSRVPCVVIGDPGPTLKLPFLRQDMTEAGLLAARALLPHGRTIVLCHQDLTGGEVELVRGFSLAAQELDLPGPTPTSLYYHLPEEPDEYFAVLRRLLRGGDRPAGVFAIRPEFALATVKIAAECDVRIPRELQVIGYPTHPMYRFAHPEITSIGIPSIRQLGRQSASLLATCMGGLPAEPSGQILPTEIIERASTLPKGHHASARTPSTDQGA